MARRALSGYGRLLRRKKLKSCPTLPCVASDGSGLSTTNDRRALHGARSPERTPQRLHLPRARMSDRSLRRRVVCPVEQAHLRRSKTALTLASSILGSEKPPAAPLASTTAARESRQGTLSGALRATRKASLASVRTGGLNGPHAQSEWRFSRPRVLPSGDRARRDRTGRHPAQRSAPPSTRRPAPMSTRRSAPPSTRRPAPMSTRRSAPPSTRGAAVQAAASAGRADVREPSGRPSSLRHR